MRAHTHTHTRTHSLRRLQQQSELEEAFENGPFFDVLQKRAGLQEREISAEVKRERERERGRGWVWGGGVE